ncbi:TetR/AcrR family transcriptional regulator [Actinomadura opuntiae]|uniref:TetR/AcrR family transcriptional regulator n=1 Tax=Actinomadura sp. OS1-43 TaxID=604315 RepID=UPI00255B3997|nr:TetR/AcrR family transcriptional regulator [Actinomadura sp. OS1-43]MDL4814544.1 TetR/AcrR family transcriptional regulator [Actinomadura sp. OS1-43]
MGVPPAGSRPWTTGRTASAGVAMDDGGGERRRLPSGRHRLSRDYVAGHQVARILAAVVEIAGTLGYRGLTVDSIIAHAGVSRATFYVHFKNKDDAFLRASDVVVEQMMDRVVEAYQGQPDATGRVRASLGALLGYLSENPRAARMCIVESMSAGPLAAERRDRALAAFAQVVTDNMHELFPHYPNPELMAETIVGGIYQVAYSRIARGETESLPELRDGLLHTFAVPDPERWGPDAPSREPESAGLESRSSRGE